MKKLVALVLVAGLAVFGMVFGGIVVMAVMVQEVLFLSQASCTTRASEVTHESNTAPGVPRQYRDAVNQAAEDSGVPLPVISAQIGAETGWDPAAVNSSSGAMGMTQAMPGTWEQYGEGDPMDGNDSVRFQGRYMAVLMGLAAPHADNDAHQVQLALAAYNWGPGNMSRNEWSLDGLPAETSGYLRKILGTSQVQFTDDCAPAGDFQNIGDLGDGEWTHPLPGSTLTSGYGPRNMGPNVPAWVSNHVGLDFATPAGGPAGPIVAPVAMRVTNIHGDFGCVMAKATEGPTFGFAFCHLDRIDVQEGDKLARGDVMGLEGGNGGSLGRMARHLHLELYHPDSPDPQFPGPDSVGVIDPTPILLAKGAV